MEIDKVKLKRQLEGVSKWFKVLKGTLIWATGVGKTFIVLYKNGLIEQYVNKFGKDVRIIIITISQDVKNRMIKDITTFIPQYINNVTIATLNEILDNTNLYTQNYDLLVVDEIDSFTSIKRRRLVNTTLIKYKHIFTSTATKFLIDSNYREFYRLAPIIDTITIEEAERLGFVSKSTHFSYRLVLPEEDYNKYVKYTSTIKVGMSKFIKLYPLLPYLNFNWTKTNFDPNPYSKMIMILQNLKKGAVIQLPRQRKAGWDKYNLPVGKSFMTGDKLIDLLAKRNNYYEGQLKFEDDMLSFKPEHIKLFIFHLTEAIKNRTRLLQEHPLKYRVIPKILKIFKGESLIFGGSINYANKLYRYLNLLKPKSTLLYHSQSKIPKLYYDKDNKPFNKKWKKGKNEGKFICYSTNKLLEYNIQQLDLGYNIMVCVQALSRGFNRPSINNIINTGHLKNKTKYVQKTGRGIRVTDEDKSANIINIYFADTIEEGNLLKNNKNNKELCLDL